MKDCKFSSTIFRVSNIIEGNSIDDDDGFDTEEWDSSDNSDETPTKHRQQTEYLKNTQPMVRTS